MKVVQKTEYTKRAKDKEREFKRSGEGYLESPSGEERHQRISKWVDEQPLEDGGSSEGKGYAEKKEDAEKKRGYEGKGKDKATD